MRMAHPPKNLSVRLQSVLDYGLEPTVGLLNLGFSDYFVPIVLDLASCLHMASAESIDLSSSQVALRDDQAVAAALIARRGWTSRLAAMAVIPSARNTGIGTWLMAQLLKRAQKRGERAMVLEVIEGNRPAIHLYRRLGFQTVRRLVSYDAGPATGSPGPALGDEADLRELAGRVSVYGLDDLPWQVSGESLAQLGPPNVAYRWQGAYIALSDPAADAIAVRSLLVLPQARGQGRALRLLRATMARYPGKTWRVPPLCPEEMGGLFERAGFERGSLSQLQMRIELQ
jgi:ribosomal protein S18 acetylase RimI-like enzyme